MAVDFNYPYTITADTPAVASQVQSNFADALTWIKAYYKQASDTLLLDGSNAMAANLAMGSNKITGLATPTLDTDAATKAYVDNGGAYPKLVGFKEATPDSTTATPPTNGITSDYVWYTNAAITHTFDASHVYVFEFSGVDVRFATNSSANNRRALSWVRDIDSSGNASTMGQIEFNSDSNGPTIKVINLDVKKRDILGLSGSFTIRPGVGLRQSGSEALTDTVNQSGGYFAIYDMGPYTA